MMSIFKERGWVYIKRYLHGIKDNPLLKSFEKAKTQNYYYYYLIIIILVKEFKDKATEVFEKD